MAIVLGGRVLTQRVTETKLVKLVPSSEVISQRVGEGAVLVHLQTNAMFELSVTATRFWELLQEGRSLAAIQTTLLEEFDVSEVQLKQEVDNLMNRLKEAKLIHVQENLSR